MICVIFSLAGLIFNPAGISWPDRALFVWLVFTLVYLLMAWITFLTSHPAEIRKLAALQDSSRTLIFLFILTTSIISLLTVILLMRSGEKLHGAERTTHILLSVLSVASSWWLVHTLYTFRYAHLYYTPVAGKQPGKQHTGGLQFPEEDFPDYLDFVYFSFVLGMTFQVSDVTITSKDLRRLAWLHGMLSFAFNTVIVAFSINVISGMIK
ncbi:DUF1345 domain-containing protein [Pedobacter sp. HMF7056]|uniref:DUF1345 domain-containing protein n=1 Tax=Hufsiella ginkgonis TaxID=2695274 RepID=A0A7K1XZP9_9SPHI|nr:DUF1345 domain-containing protein [Hufsiella ginkgonis]